MRISIPSFNNENIEQLGIFSKDKNRREAVFVMFFACIYKPNSVSAKDRR